MAYKPHLEDFWTYIPTTLSINALQKLLRDKNVLAAGGPLHRLLSIAEQVETGKIQFKPKFVWADRSFWTVESRKYLERVFQCPVYNKYVCAEVGVMGLECQEQGGFHIDPVNFYMEIVDDNGQIVEKGAQAGSLSPSS